MQSREDFYMIKKMRQQDDIPASTLQMVPAQMHERVPCSGYQHPTRPGDIPPDHGRLGAVIMPGLAGYPLV